MSVLGIPRTSRAASKCPMSPYGITSVGSQNGATPFLMSLTRTSSADYGLYSDTVDIVFDEEELDNSDVEEDHLANENNAHQSRNLTDTQR